MQKCGWTLLELRRELRRNCSFVKFDNFDARTPQQVDFAASTLSELHPFDAFGIAQIQNSGKIIIYPDFPVAIVFAFAADADFPFAVFAYTDAVNIYVINIQTAAKRISDNDIPPPPVVAKTDRCIAVIADIKRVETGISDVEITAVYIGDIERKATFAFVYR